MDGNYENRDNITRNVLLGDNDFETGILTVGANTTLDLGTIVQKTGGKFAVSAGGAAEISLAVVVEPVANATGASVDVPVRVCIAGRVDKELLKIGATKATDAQADLLRKFGMVPLFVQQAGGLDNS